MEQPSLDNILNDEMEQAKIANNQRWLMRGYLGLLALAVVSYLLIFLIIGRDPRPRFKEKYWRDIPTAFLSPSFGIPYDLHPMVVSYNYSDESLGTDDFTAQMLYLAQKKYVTLEKLPGNQYQLHRNPDALITDPIDQRAMSLLFDRVANKSDTLRLADLEEYARNYPNSFEKTWDRWIEAVSKQAADVKLIDSRKSTISTWMLMFALFVFIAGAIVSYIALKEGLSVFFPLVTSATGLLMIPFAWLTRSRTPAGAELYAYTKALRNWLEDFTNLEERPITDVTVWGHFMMYAVMFDMSENVLEGLRTYAPEVLNSPELSSTTSWMGYDRSLGTFEHQGMSAISSFGDTFSSSMGAVRAASSDSGGGGGGFSGGGGGGFGGGGGGAR
ncbi:MAG: DUF2207 domain-containing protein [Actinomycetaceae bacterium]|nr:DUF2207 domain-containing protein [Actinomycetaceae bacterium]